MFKALAKTAKRESKVEEEAQRRVCKAVGGAVMRT